MAQLLLQVTFIIQSRMTEKLLWKLAMDMHILSLKASAQRWHTTLLTFIGQSKSNSHAWV